MLSAGGNTTQSCNKGARAAMEDLPTVEPQSETTYDRRRQGITNINSMNDDKATINKSFDITMITPPTSSPFILEDDRPLAKSTGAVWLWPRKENGKYWPVMLCPDTIHPRDPEWIEDNSLIPAFLLGRRKWIWVRDDERLKPWDASHDYLHGLARFENEDIVDGDEKVAKIQKQWRRAYRQDAMQLWGPEQWLHAERALSRSSNSG